MKRLFSCFALLLATAAHAAPMYATLSGETMGTSYTVRYRAASNAGEPAVQSRIEARLQSLIDSMSTFEPNSLISQFNRLPAEEKLAVGADFLQVLADSRDIYRQSNGSFDPTVYPLVELWGFGAKQIAERLRRPPSKAEIAAAKSQMGFEQVVNSGVWLSKRQNGIGLDFSAIAKGYAVDALAVVLRDEFGVNDYLVEIGGEIASQGCNPSGQPWRIAIASPDSDSTDSVFTLQQPAGQRLQLATSGNYQNFVVYRGKTYGHSISPLSGEPVQGNAASVTVLHDSVALADGWATALSALPYPQALALAQRQQLKALFVMPSENASPSPPWQVVRTTALDSLLKMETRK
ncbi:thiamine biosynthesis lipoprotein [Pasteurella testudinis DSM 23072]|uniref:FAD:protein FMN transferase n=1 Tax=Pasteurella testudinis DSM 23072 TaxID=1122938 RepID=A0A1W1UMA2_9PAST|nr:FAD:protein FMN transferase [Pasteurella testudinis]SMB81834.1 thiamine biosynthesis lipoprotein [Pasteurella testudinis DSM 23072]SUB50298.1 thiamine biosynthesis lipoprotein ApbE [Pasteurella testudinis]